MSKRNSRTGKCRVERELGGDSNVMNSTIKNRDTIELIKKNTIGLDVSNIEFLTFSRAVIDFIKKRLRVENDDFDNYINYKKSKFIDCEKFLKILLSETIFCELIKESNMKDNAQNRIQAKRCIEVISLALLKCSNYNDLRDSLHELTGLSKRYIYDLIKKYLPVLHTINPNVNISKWLPQKSFEYNLILVSKLIKKKEWELLSPDTQEEFNNLRKKHNCEPARIPLYVECDKGHKFITNAFNLQRRKKGCRKCADEDKVKYYMNTIKKLVNAKNWTLKYPKKQDQLDLLVKKLKCAPNAVPLTIECRLGHTIITNAHRLNQKLLRDTEGCLKCSHLKKTRYNLVSVSKMIRNRGAILIYPQTQVQYNASQKSHKCKPFKVPLKIECIRGHYFNSNASLIQQNHWCPYCKQIKSAIGRITHIIFEYLTIKYLQSKCCQVDFESKINYNTKHQVDILIKRNKMFIENVEKFQTIVSIPDNINEIAIDFTFSTEKKFILSKFYKNYQNKNRYLIVVLLDRDIKKFNVEEIAQFSSDIKFKYYIKILSFKEFLAFLDLFHDVVNWRLLSNEEKAILTKYNNFFNLANDATDSEANLNKLIEIGEKYRNCTERIGR